MTARSIRPAPWSAASPRNAASPGSAALARIVVITTFAALGALISVPQAAAAQSGCGAYYTARPGDTLAELAARCGITLPALLAANPGVKEQQQLEAGARLRIPRPDARQPSPVEACGASYTIRPGDSLTGIAQKCGLTVPLLVAANGRLPDPLGLAAGRTIRIPDLPRAVIDSEAMIVVGPEAVAGEAPAEVAAPELTRVEGVLEEGAECVWIRTEDGTRHALLGRIGAQFVSGERAVALGVPADPGAAGECGTETALTLRILYRPPR